MISWIKSFFKERTTMSSKIMINGRIITDSTPDKNIIKVYLGTPENPGEMVSVVENTGSVSITVKGSVEAIEAASASISIMGNTSNVSTASGNIDVKGDAQDISTVSGDVSCSDVSGGVSTVSGSIKASMIYGSASSVSGSIKTK